MVLKQINIRVDDKSEIYRWTKYQDNKTASITSALTSAIEEYGYTDLVKAMIKQGSRNNSSQASRNPDNIQNTEIEEEHKNISNSYAPSPKANVTSDTRNNPQDGHSEITGSSSLAKDNVTTIEQSDKKEERNVHAKSVLNNRGLS